MNITPHFATEEFACKDGTPYPVKFKDKLVALCHELEIVRGVFGNKPITINSGYRTPAYNRKVGGVKDSTHIQGIAVDFTVQGVAPRKVAAKLRELIAAGKLKAGGVGDYGNFTHYDIRGTNARWRGK